MFCSLADINCLDSMIDATPVAFDVYLMAVAVVLYYLGLCLYVRR